MKASRYLFLCLACASFANAQNIERKRPFFQASRALAMGDAYSAYNAGFEAVYYNPAGVAKRHATKIKYVDLELTGSQAMYSYFKTAVSSFGTLAGIVENVTRNPGEVYAVGLSFLPQFIARNFSVGLLARTYSEALVDPTTTDLDLFAYSDMGVYMQYGVSLWGGIIKLGVGAKALNRAELQRTYTPEEYALGLSFGSQWQEGIGYGFDAGLMATAPIAMLPTLALTVQDIGNTTFLDRRVIFTGASGRPGAPAAIQQRINVGAGIEIKHAPGLKSAFQLEIKDVVNVATEYLEHLHLGWEFEAHKSIYLRAGLNQGRYWTAGFGFSISGVGLEFATYGENLLVGTGQRRDTRKYVGRYVLSF